MWMNISGQYITRPGINIRMKLYAKFYWGDKDNLVKKFK